MYTYLNDRLIPYLILVYIFIDTKNFDFSVNKIYIYFETRGVQC